MHIKPTRTAEPETAEDETPARPRFRIMPLTLIMLSLMLVAKVSEVYFGARDIVRHAYASPAPKKASEPAPAEHAEAPAKGNEDGGHGGGHGETEPPPEPKAAGEGKMTIKEIEALKAQQGTPQYTQTELDLLQNLTKRREELNAREQELTLKAKVLEATEKRINDKVTEMKALQTELEKVVASYNAQQDKELMSLVRIYENMKPADAAAIFNEMDMPILLAVVGKMSERKVAPVLAGMDPKKARDITEELAELRRRQARTAGLAESAR